MKNHKIELTYGKELIAAIANRCKEVDTGARNIDYILTQNLLPDLSSVLLRYMAAGKPCSRIHIYINKKGEFVYKTVSSSLIRSFSGKKLSGSSSNQKVIASIKKRKLTQQQKKESLKEDKAQGKGKILKKSFRWLNFLKRD